MGDFIEHSYEVLYVPDTDVDCVTEQTSKGFSIFTIFVGGGLGGEGAS